MRNVLVAMVLVFIGLMLTAWVGSVLAHPRELPAPAAHHG
jgi:hypothetical protein